MISSNGKHDVEHGDDALESAPSNDALMFTLSGDLYPLSLVTAASFVLMLAVVTWDGPMKSYGYALAVPIVSLVFCIAAILLIKFMGTLYAQYGRHISHFLFTWNFTGACFLTFSSPFTVTGNGYFAAWACVVTSAMAMGFTADAFRSRLQGMGPLLGLGAFSLITIIALVDFVGKGQYHRGQSIFAMIIAVFTIILIGAIMYLQKTHSEITWFKRARLGSYALFAFMWLLVACLCTFSGPFNSTGNGYFASWGGAACSAYAAFSAWQEVGISTDDLVGFLTPASNGSDGPTGLSATIS